MIILSASPHSLPLCGVSVFISSDKGTSHIGLEVTPMTLFNLNYLFQELISKNLISKVLGSYLFNIET